MNTERIVWVVVEVKIAATYCNACYTVDTSS
jgi:hypothetical protein